MVAKDPVKLREEKDCPRRRGQEQESGSNRKGRSRSNDENGAGGLYDRLEAYLSPGHISRRENAWQRYGGELGAVADRLAGFFLLRA